MNSVAASELQKNFGEWVERCQANPVEITRYGRPSAYLVSADLFQQLWSRLQRTIPVEALSDEEVSAIMGAAVTTAEP
nr:type II toxin-antitoxin system Phd/YefM family antitoxin [uncultured Gellertiella sp.]